ncbi:MAG TPA: hypothetical protein VGH90_10260, partial [Chthoniobacteraceae bacterium]
MRPAISGKGAARPPVVVPTTDAKAKSDGYTQILMFQDGRQLRGELVSMGKDGIVWRRPDADVPIRFSKTEVRKIILFPADASAADSEPGDESPLRARATVKLPGADWLFGELTSADGKNFSLRINSKMQMPIPRSAIEWIYFDKMPAPAFRYTGNIADFDAWHDGSGDAPLVSMDGETASIVGNRLSGYNASMGTLDVSFEIPPGNSENLMLGYLYSNSKGPLACVSVDDSGISIDVSQVVTSWRLTENVEEEKKKARKYRILYDAGFDRLLVLRNDSKVLD